MKNRTIKIPNSISFILIICSLILIICLLFLFDPKDIKNIGGIEDFLKISGSLIAGAGTLCAVFMAYRQLKCINNQLNCTTLLEIDEIMHNCRDNWQKFNSYNPDFTQWSDDEKNNADLVSRTLDRVSFLAIKGYVKEQDILELYGTVFARTWLIIGESIKEYRAIRKEPREISEGGFQRKHYEIMAHKAIRYLEKNHPSIILKVKSNDSSFSQKR